MRFFFFTNHLLTGMLSIVIMGIAWLACYHGYTINGLSILSMVSSCSPVWVLTFYNMLSPNDIPFTRWHEPPMGSRCQYLELWLRKLESDGALKIGCPPSYWWIIKLSLVGGMEHVLLFPICFHILGIFWSWPILFRGVAQPPTRSPFNGTMAHFGIQSWG